MRPLETPQWQMTAYCSFLLADWARFSRPAGTRRDSFMIRINVQRTNVSIFSGRAYAYLLKPNDAVTSVEAVTSKFEFFQEDIIVPEVS